MQGWIKLFRKIVNHWLYFAEPFDKFHAFMDLLLMCNHCDTKILLDGTLTDVRSGEMITSIRSLCDRWKWSNTKVKRFLNALEGDGMITVKSDSRKTLVKVHNYAKYQGCDLVKNDTKTTQEHHPNDTETLPKHTNKNVKNDKNVKNVKERETKKDRQTERETDFKDIQAFEPPSLSEVQSFIACENLRCSANDFFDYYSANGWVVGQTPMRNWKAMCRKWSRSEKQKAADSWKLKSPPSYDLEKIKRDSMYNTEI